MDAPSQPLLPLTEPEMIAYIDGASRGNPGPASYGVVIQDSRGNTLETISKFLGQATNNVAEWSALLAALEYALSRQAKRLKIYCDSELVARQMQGRYRVQSPDLRPFFEKARKLSGQFGYFSIQHIPREQNRPADRLANQALDEACHSRASGQTKVPISDPIQPVQHAGTDIFSAVVEEGRLRPLPPLPELEEGAEYEVRVSKRYPHRSR